MGNSGGSERKSDEEFVEYLSTMVLVRKEHSEHIGKDIDLHRPNLSEFEEDLVLLVEITFDDGDVSNQNPNDIISRFRNEVNLRKGFNCQHVSELLFVNYKVFSGLCVEKLMCRIAIEYSDENLQHYITDSKTMRSSMQIKESPTAMQVIHFLSGLCEALVVLKRNGRHHGYVAPANILIYNRSAIKPLYKLVDVALISRYPKLTNQRL
jgi:hypothetical protein